MEIVLQQDDHMQFRQSLIVRASLKSFYFDQDKTQTKPKNEAKYSIHLFTNHARSFA
jgi:hypothetical protein